MFQNKGKLAVIDALQQSMAILELTPSGIVIDANGKYLSAMGYSLSEIKGQHHRFFCDPNSVQSASYDHFWDALGRGEVQSAHYKHVGKNAKVIWFQATYTPVLDRAGRISKIVKLATDVTAFKQTAIEHASQVQAISRSQAVIEFTPSGDIISANDNFLNAMGYSLAEIVGKRHSMFCDPAYAATAEYSSFWKALADGEYKSAEFRRVGKNGAVVFIQASYNPIFDDDGKVTRVVKFATDITPTVIRRKQNEKLSVDIDTELGDVVEQIVSATGMANSASAASSETGAIISAVAAAAEEMSANVNAIASSMTIAKQGAEGVFTHTEAANASADALDRSAASMTNVVSMIQAIASQINLLALNATIESARAGDAGRGFAVVATEVKNLANQAASSTQSIAQEISTMQSVTKEVVSALSLISTNMSSVLDSVSSVAAAIDEQYTVTSEISGNMQAAVGAVQSIEESLGKITSAFDVVASASGKVKASVEALVG